MTSSKMTDAELRAKSDDELTALVKWLEEQLTPGASGFLPPLPHENIDLIDRARAELNRRGLSDHKPLAKASDGNWKPEDCELLERTDEGGRTIVTVVHTGTGAREVLDNAAFQTQLAHPRAPVAWASNAQWEKAAAVIVANRQRDQRGS